MAERREKQRIEALKRAEALKSSEGAEAGKATEGNRQKPRERRKQPSKEGKFTRHIWPAALVEDLCRRGGYAHFCIVQYLDKQWFKNYRKPEPFTVNEVPVNNGKIMDRCTKSQTLSDLEKWGWIKIERKKGRPSHVSIKWHD
jgi:hypothetical protein